jgi:hypothetical protein
MARQTPTAIKSTIQEIISGTWIERGGTEPSVVKYADGTEAARVQIVGIIVGKSEGTPANLVIDDGTGSIMLKAFEKVPGIETITPGNLARVVARPRKYGEDLFLVPEVIKLVQDAQWVQVHKKEVELRENSYGQAQIQETAPPIGAIVQEETVDVFTEQTVQVKTTDVQNSSAMGEKDVIVSPQASIIDTIRSLDDGQGAETEEVLTQAGCNEDDLQKLLARGEIFQVSPGFLKVLE